MKIGQRIKSVRLQRNLTQEYIAEKLNMTPAGYGKIENDKVEISITNLKKIASALGVPMSSLLDDEKYVLNNFGEVNAAQQGNYYSGQEKIYQKILEEYQREIAFWKDKFEKETNYLKSIIEKLLSKDSSE